MVGVNPGSNNAIRADVAIAGGGIIGVALGLELRLRGASVTVLERDQAMRAASWAAGGMLAVEDPQNPPLLMDLARLSARLYPEWLQRIEELSGLRVPMRTQQALQWVGPADLKSLARDGIATAEEIHDLAPGLHEEGPRFRLIQEGSVDPRDLCAALPRAFVAAGGRLVEACGVTGISQADNEVRVHTASGTFVAGHFVNCCGAWAGAAIEGLANLPVEPVKGQMVELHCAPDRLRCVVRAPNVYLIPRGDGRVTVGATIEHVGFDDDVDDGAISGLVQTAQKLLPDLRSQQPIKSWAGLRPGTPDGLPVMGPALDSRGENKPPRCWHATGHYRDGILLAPATARVMAQTVTGDRTAIALDAFAPARFTPALPQG